MKWFLAVALVGCGAAGAGGDAASAFVSGLICSDGLDPNPCSAVFNTPAPEAVRRSLLLCATATKNAFGSKDKKKQVAECTKAAEDIKAFLVNNGPGLKEDVKQACQVAVAAAFDYAAWGFEVQDGQYTGDHCLQIENAYLWVVAAGKSPGMDRNLKRVTEQTKACRKKLGATPAPPG